MQLLFSCAVRPQMVSAITLTTFTRKDLIANTFLNDEAIDKILKHQKIITHLEYRKKHPQAFNYAQFEVWITDILKGGNGFPMPKFPEEDKE